MQARFRLFSLIAATVSSEKISFASLTYDIRYAIIVKMKQMGGDGMRTVAIVSEFNPFHNGHRYLVDSVRAKYGEDTCIIALMSGNYTQRGDVALANKFTRAASAVLGGVDLVLEIPFPFSASSAEFYATAGVRIAAGLGIVDTLAFGSECGDLEVLRKAAELLNSEGFQKAIKRAVKEEPCRGYPEITEELLRERAGEECAALLRDPNNVLAIEYLRANLRLGTPLEPFTVTRIGSYHSTSLASLSSATALRSALIDGNEAAYDAMPAASALPLREAILTGTAPATLDRLALVFLSYIRTTPLLPDDDLGHHLRDAAIRAADFSEFTTLVATKRYTNAYIRRNVLHRYFGITSADLSEAPAYTQILGMNGRGRLALRRAARASTISLLTKPADARALTGAAARQAALSQRADLLYPLAMPRPTPGNADVLAAPFLDE